MSVWKRLLSRIRFWRNSRSRYFALDEDLTSALESLASQERRPEEEIRSAMRFAVSKFSTMEEVNLSIDAISSVYRRLRRKISVDKS